MPLEGIGFAVEELTAEFETSREGQPLGRLAGGLETALVEEILLVDPSLLEGHEVSSKGDGVGESETVADDEDLIVQTGSVVSHGLSEDDRIVPLKGEEVLREELGDESELELVDAVPREVGALHVEICVEMFPKEVEIEASG